MVENCLAFLMGLCNSLFTGLGQDQQQHPDVHTGELVGEGSVAVAVAVGVSDM